MGNSRPVKVFISYSHDSEQYQTDILELAQRLRADGVEAILDQFFPFPREGWTRWMQRQLTSADFVLCCCSERYSSYFDGVDPPIDSGKGSNWEGFLISQDLQEHRANNSKFIPVVVGSQTREPPIPLPLRPYRRFVLDTDYEDLYRLLTNQSAVVPVPVAGIRQLPVMSPGVPDVDVSLRDVSVIDEYIRTIVAGSSGSDDLALYELERAVDYRAEPALRDVAIRQLISYVTALDTSFRYSVEERLLRSQVVRTIIRLTEGDLGRFLPRGALSSIDLALFDFRGSSLDGVDFSGSFMIECDFRGACLDGCTFDGCSLRNSRFDDATLRGAHFGNSDWFNALGLTTSQIGAVSLSNLREPPVGEDKLLAYLSGAYAYSFKGWGQRIQAELKLTWETYSQPGGVFDLVSMLLADQVP